MRRTEDRVLDHQEGDEQVVSSSKAALVAELERQWSNFEMGDVVGCGFKWTDNFLHFTLNGIKLGRFDMCNVELQFKISQKKVLLYRKDCDFSSGRFPERGRPHSRRANFGALDSSTVLDHNCRVTGKPCDACLRFCAQNLSPEILLVELGHSCERTGATSSAGFGRSVKVNYLQICCRGLISELRSRQDLR
jgi:hypothetical protein